jgi:glycerophosphoryl diester phosphodiesterase
MRKLGLLLLLIAAISAFAQQRHIAVIAHRGEHLQHPENTMEAFQGAVDAGADFFELDVRTTLDHRLVLMHDATVDRMTDKKGQVAQMTFDAIRSLNVQGSRVPAFEEALEFAHGKIGVYVDCKYIAPADLVNALEKSDMSRRVVIYGGAAFLKDVVKLNPELKVMPEASSVEHLQSLLEAIPLKVVAFDARDFLDPVIAVARKAGTDIYVDRLGPADNEASWQDAIDRGATGIQTDHPAQLAGYLKSKGHH